MAARTSSPGCSNVARARTSFTGTGCSPPFSGAARAAAYQRRVGERFEAEGGDPRQARGRREGEGLRIRVLPARQQGAVAQVGEGRAARGLRVVQLEAAPGRGVASGAMAEPVV